MPLLLQFLIGLLFGTGLIVAGMSDPAKVLNFLDVAAVGTTWDASLGLVMAGAVAVAFVGYRLVLRRARPLFDTAFHLPRKTAIDAPVLIGPALFGIGWGMVGLCPGPAFVALGAGYAEALVFVPAMLGGMLAARMLALRRIAAESRG
jgi:uncharacterized membrane protein YedE/YeeE